MSLPRSTIEQLQEALKKEQEEKRGWIREIDRLHEALEEKDKTIAALELANATLRRRVENFETGRRASEI